MRVAALACSLALLSLLGSPAIAQPAARAPAGKEDEARHKNEARAHFEKGLSLFDSEAYDAALAEFNRAHALYPTRPAIKNAAQCLRLLKRYDEALEAFEELLALPSLPRDDKEMAEREVTALRRLVGSVAVADAEPGAAIVIDGRSRGSTPTAPLRVSAGTHAVRVSKEGFEPFWAQIDVTGGESVLVTAHLRRYPNLIAPLTPPPPSAPPTPPPDRLLVPAALTVGLGAAALAVGGIFGALAWSDTNAIRAHCAGNVCPGNQQAAAQSAGTKATVSTVGFAVGGALAVAGVTLFVIRSRSHAPAAALVVGPGSLFTQGAF